MKINLIIIAKKLFKEFKILFIRKHLREISFTLGSITFGEWLRILTYLFLSRKDILEGNCIKKFEDEFAKYIDAKYAISFGSGRMSFYAILKALGIKDDDEVILPAYTCVVVPNAVIYCGAKPIYVDINPHTFVMDVEKIENKITNRTRVIVAQHMFNSFCDMDTISKISKLYNLKVIEDCAHALGADYNGKKAGNFSDAAFFSLEQSKIITSWMGGLALTNDLALAQKLRRIQEKTAFLDEKATRKLVSQIAIYYILSHPYFLALGKYIHWILNKLNFLIHNITYEEENTEIPKNYPVRLSNIQARIALNQLRNIDINLKHRRKIAESYEIALKNLHIKLNERTDKYNPSCIRYAFLSRDREKLRELFKNNQIELGEWFNSVLHPINSSLEKFYYKKGTCPIAEFAAMHCANLPTHLHIEEKDAYRINSILRIAYEKELLFDLDSEDI